MIRVWDHIFALPVRSDMRTNALVRFRWTFDYSRPHLRPNVVHPDRTFSCIIETAVPLWQGNDVNSTPGVRLQRESLAEELTGISGACFGLLAAAVGGCFSEGFGDG